MVLSAATLDDLGLKSDCESDDKDSLFLSEIGKK